MTSPNYRVPRSLYSARIGETVHLRRRKTRIEHHLLAISPRAEDASVCSARKIATSARCSRLRTHRRERSVQIENADPSYRYQTGTLCAVPSALTVEITATSGRSRNASTSSSFTKHLRLLERRPVPERESATNLPTSRPRGGPLDAPSRRTRPPRGARWRSSCYRRAPDRPASARRARAAAF